MAIAVYPGTFDPITYGHIDVAVRAAKAFEKLIILIMNNPLKKNSFFDVEERIDLAKQIFEENQNIDISYHNGLLYEYLTQKKLNVVVRGLRAVSDFEYEMQMAAANRMLNNNLDTFFLMTDTKYSFISSTLVKEIASLGGNIDAWVPKIVKEKVIKKLKQ